MNKKELIKALKVLKKVKSDRSLPITQNLKINFSDRNVSLARSNVSTTVHVTFPPVDKIRGEFIVNFAKFFEVVNAFDDLIEFQENTDEHGNKILTLINGMTKFDLFAGKELPPDNIAEAKYTILADHDLIYNTLRSIGFNAYKRYDQSFDGVLLPFLFLLHS